VRAFDPTVGDPVDGLPEVEIAESELEACNGASVLAVLTEWENFRWVDPAEVARRLLITRVVDGRNLLDRSVWRSAGFDYQGIGR
jgi:UDPglucose 6-dehydrogenase